MPGRADLVSEPGIAADLLLARRGQAYFSRRLAEMREVDFVGPSALKGLNRAQVVARVGLHARSFAGLIDDIAGEPRDPENPPISSTAEWEERVAFAASLPTRALRYLSQHSAVHLNVAWRDLPGARWLSRSPYFTGGQVCVADTPWMRAREVWLGSLDLNNGARWADLPESFVDRMLDELAVGQSELAGFSLHPLDRPDRVPARHGQPVVRGKSCDLLAWALKRGSTGVVMENGSTPVFPR